MSTLVTFAVVAAAIVGVVRIALNDPDQPATVRRPIRGRKPGPATGVAMSAQPASVRAVTMPERALAGAFRAPARGDGSVWTRVRSGIALVLLVTVVGAMLALAVGAVLVGGALALRSAVS